MPFCVHVFHVDHAVVDGVPNDVGFEVDVSCPSAAEPVVCDFNSALIVVVKRDPDVRRPRHEFLYLSGCPRVSSLTNVFHTDEAVVDRAPTEVVFDVSMCLVRRLLNQLSAISLVPRLPS